jgi:hypothetical protein
MEAEYGRPAKDFVAQSFRECPTVTVSKRLRQALLGLTAHQSMAVVFSLIAFVPVVSAV